MSYMVPFLTCHHECLSMNPSRPSPSHKRQQETEIIKLIPGNSLHHAFVLKRWPFSAACYARSHASCHEPNRPKVVKAISRYNYTPALI